MQKTSFSSGWLYKSMPPQVIAVILGDFVECGIAISGDVSLGVNGIRGIFSIDRIPRQRRRQKHIAAINKCAACHSYFSLRRR